MPMYNAENYVCQALDAILCEKETAIEVIVINDRSTNFSVQQVLKFSDSQSE